MSIMNRHRRGRLRRALRSGVSFFAAGTLLASTAEPVLALPQSGQVAAGDAQIASNAAEMAIHQNSQNAVINWQSFNIAAGERVSVLQPNAQAALLNRVLGSNPSEIFGQLQANGRVFLVNPAGVYFAPGAQVDAGAIIASTMNITNADFMAGRYNFVGTEHDGKVINKASLAAQNGGLIALLGKDVVNEGVVVAKKGTAVLAAGEEVTLDFGGDGKVEVVPTKAALEQAVTNKGLVEADGGLVFMSAATGEMLTRSAVNQDGVVRASSLADAPGAIRITAHDVNLGTGSLTDASGMQGGTIEIGGGWQGTGTLAHATNVSIAHGAARIAEPALQVSCLRECLLHGRCIRCIELTLDGDCQFHQSSRHCLIHLAYDIIKKKRMVYAYEGGECHANLGICGNKSRPLAGLPLGCHETPALP